MSRGACFEFVLDLILYGLERMQDST